jgi:hypothetical protein
MAPPEKKKIHHIGTEVTKDYREQGNRDTSFFYKASKKKKGNIEKIGSVAISPL